MLKMMMDPMGGIVLTMDGNAILRELDVSHPAAKSMIELSRTQDEEVGDGTTSVIVLGTSPFTAVPLAHVVCCIIYVSLSGDEAIGRYWNNIYYFVEAAIPWSESPSPVARRRVQSSQLTRVVAPGRAIVFDDE
jgi:hypothetical protein